MTVAELQDMLDHFDGRLPVVMEIKGVGYDMRSEIKDVQKALYLDEEVHLIGVPVEVPST